MRDDEPTGIIYRTHDNSAPAAAPAAEETDDKWGDWNRWADQKGDAAVQRAFDGWLASIIAEAIAQEGSEVLDAVAKVFKIATEKLPRWKARSTCSLRC